MNMIKGLTKKEYMAEYYALHADELKVKMAEYYALHADELKAKSAEYYALHADEIKAKSAERSKNIYLAEKERTEFLINHPGELEKIRKQIMKGELL